jgi:molybdopterin-guanine dinucleotide biosynthesis protein A
VSEGLFRSSDCAAVILAGGQSRRFGEDKAFFEIHSTPMIKLIADNLHSHFETVLVAGGDPDRMATLGLTCHVDPVPGKGALGGIYNAMMHTDATSIFCCGCDMPLINGDVIRAVLDNAADEDILLPMIDGVRQPLHAVYKRSLLDGIERLVRTGDAYLPQLIKQARLRLLDESIFSGIADYQLSFVSFNDKTAIAKYSAYLRNCQ